MKKGWFIIAIILFATISITITVSEARADIYGLLQISSKSSPLVQLVIYRASKENIANQLMNNYWAGIRSTCADCNLDYSSCSSTLSPTYFDTFQNKPIIFPYVSSKNVRIILMGVPEADGNRICEEFAENIGRTTGKNAICIRAKSP